jgi:hypothetical protein
MDGYCLDNQWHKLHTNMKFLFLVILILAGCGSSGGDSSTIAATENSDPWPIQVPIKQGQYLMTTALIAGMETECAFDTGAPRGIYLRTDQTVTAVVGNYERTLDPVPLWETIAPFMTCIVGMGFFDGMSEYRIDLEAGLLEVR